MNFTTHHAALQVYMRDLKEWKRKNGLNGGGGDFDRKAKIYKFKPEPDAKDYGLLDGEEGEWFKKYLPTFRAQALK